LIERVKAGETKLAHEEHFGYLRSLLTELDVPVQSQMLVFSKTSSPRTKVVMFTGHENPTYVARAVALGAAGESVFDFVGRFRMSLAWVLLFDLAVIAVVALLAWLFSFGTAGSAELVPSRCA